MHKLLEEFKKLHYQQTFPGAIFLGIRQKIEYKANVKERIGAVFKDGQRGILAVSKAGCGKTTTMKKIFNGLGLDGINKDNQKIGKWISSTGSSTGVGIFEILETYNDSIIMMDELSLDSSLHLHLIKQIANKEILRPKSKSIEGTPFSSLVIGAANCIKLPRSSTLLEHLLAVLDRFIILKVRTPDVSNNKMIRIALGKETFSRGPVNWDYIISCLTRKSTEILNKDEEELLEDIWQEKIKEILDITRPQFRNAFLAKDIFLFIKRVFGTENITKDKELSDFAKEMINDCIIFNPVNILHLEPVEEVIYNTIKSKNIASTNEILTACEKSGITLTRQVIHRYLDKMLNSRVITRTSKGKYSFKKHSVQSSPKNNKQNNKQTSSKLANLL